MCGLRVGMLGFKPDFNSDLLMDANSPTTDTNSDLQPLQLCLSLESVSGYISCSSCMKCSRRGWLAGTLNPCASAWEVLRQDVIIWQAGPYTCPQQVPSFCWSSSCHQYFFVIKTQSEIIYFLNGRSRIYLYTTVSRQQEDEALPGRQGLVEVEFTGCCFCSFLRVSVYRSKLLTPKEISLMYRCNRFRLKGYQTPILRCK